MFPRIEYFQDRRMRHYNPHMSQKILTKILHRLIPPQLLFNLHHHLLVLNQIDNLLILFHQSTSDLLMSL